MGTKIATKPTVLTVLLDFEETASVIKALCEKVLKNNNLDHVFAYSDYELRAPIDGIEDRDVFCSIRQKKVDIAEVGVVFTTFSSEARLEISGKVISDELIAFAAKKPGVPRAANQNTGYTLEWVKEDGRSPEVEVKMSITYDDVSDFA